MASGYDNGEGVAGTVGNEQTGEDSSESDGETEPAKSFHRRLSTNREIKCAVSFVCRIYIDHILAGSVVAGGKEAWSLFTCNRVRDSLVFVDRAAHSGFYNTSSDCMHSLYCITYKIIVNFCLYSDN